MSSRLRTLVVFDTNNLRHTLGDVPFYADFQFGKPYSSVVNFIQEHGLQEFVDIAVSKMAIDELKNQKQKAYKEDTKKFEDLYHRLKELPHLNGKIPEIKYEDIDILDHISKSTDDYLRKNDIKVISYKAEHSHDILENMIRKVVDTDNVRSPFKNIGSGKRDAGFKDNIIWESFMRYEGLKNFDKVIFLSKDNGFDKYCKIEFEKLQNKFMSLMKEPIEVISELESDYKNYIEEKDFHDWAQQDVFRSFIENELKYKTSILIDGEEYPIYNYKILEYCHEVENNSYIDNEGNDVEEHVIQTKVLISTKIGEEKQERNVSGATLMEEEFTIAEIAFEPDLI